MTLFQSIFILSKEYVYVVESRNRAILKTLSYRALLTLILVIITYLFTGDLIQTSGITIIFSISATIVYYLHERMWTKVSLK